VPEGEGGRAVVCICEGERSPRAPQGQEDQEEPQGQEDQEEPQGQEDQEAPFKLRCWSSCMMTILVIWSVRRMKILVWGTVFGSSG